MRQSHKGCFPFPFDVYGVKVIIARFNREKLILMSQSGYRVVHSNEDFGVLGVLRVLGGSGFLGVQGSWASEDYTSQHDLESSKVFHMTSNYDKRRQ